MVETTNHPAETCLRNSLDAASSSDCNVNDVTGEDPNGFIDGLVLSDEEASEDSRFRLAHRKK